MKKLDHFNWKTWHFEIDFLLAEVLDTKNKQKFFWSFSSGVMNWKNQFSAQSLWEFSYQDPAKRASKETIWNARLIVSEIDVSRVQKASIARFTSAFQNFIEIKPVFCYAR